MKEFNFDAVTDQQMREIAQEMARTRFSYIPMQTERQLLDPTFRQQQGILSNDVMQMTRHDFECTIRLLTSLGVPVPSYHRYRATYTTQEIEIESLNATAAASTAADLLNCQLYQLSLQEIEQSKRNTEGAQSMEEAAQTKIPALSITLKHATGSTHNLTDKLLTIDDCGSSDGLWHAADTLLRAWSWSVGSGYDDIDFSIQYQDGYIYRGTLELMKHSPSHLAEYMRNYCLIHSGRKCPAHWKSEQYTQFLETFCKRREELAFFLDHYQVGVKGE